MFPFFRKKITFFIVAFIWVLLFFFLPPQSWMVPMIVASSLSFVGLSYLIIKGSDKISAFMGKVVVVVGLLQLLFTIIDNLYISFSSNEVWLLYAVFCGLLIERNSPHQQFYTWMFLGIASKIQFVLVVSTIALLEGTSGLFPSFLWWSLVAILILLVPLAMFKQKVMYRLVVWLGTAFSLILLLDLYYRSSELDILVLFLPFVTVLWSPFVDRWVGRKIFTTS